MKTKEYLDYKSKGFGKLDRTKTYTYFDIKDNLFKSFQIANLMTVY